MPRRADPGELYYPTDDDLKWVRDRMEKRSIGVQELADAAGISRQAIYLLLKGTTKRTPRWHLIVKHLGGDPPSRVDSDDKRLLEIARRWSEMTDADRELVHATALRLAKKS